MKSISKLYVLLIAIFTIVSCKEKEVNKTQTPVEDKLNLKASPQNDKPPYFNLTLKAVFEKNDFVQVFYIQSHEEKFSEEQSFRKKVEHNSGLQLIKFEFPQEDYPYNIRLDLGENKTQQTMVIEELLLNYGRKSFSIKSKDLIKYFNFNKGVQVSSDSTTFILKSFKEGEVDRYDPFIVGNDELINTLMIEL